MITLKDAQKEGHGLFVTEDIDPPSYPNSRVKSFVRRANEAGGKDSFSPRASKSLRILWSNQLGSDLRSAISSEVNMSNTSNTQNKGNDAV